MADSAMCHLGISTLLGSRRSEVVSGDVYKHAAPPANKATSSESTQSTAEPEVTAVAPAARATALAQEKGSALGERLRAIPSSGAARKFVTLGDLRGSSGSAFEGSLKDASKEGFAFCLGPLGRPRDEFYAVKGPWMLRFKKNSAGAKSYGVPIPLDGAEVTPVGDTEFEISNYHVKDDFLGKGLSDFAGGTFVHSVLVRLAAPSDESRDAWVASLNAQVKRLAEGQARKRRAAADIPGVGRSNSEKTTATVAAVGGVAARVFADFEAEEEYAVLGHHRPDLVVPFPGAF